MQERVLGGIALGVVMTLGGWGCSAAPKRGEAPIQFRQWKPDDKTASAKDREREKEDMSFPVTPPTVASTTDRPSIWTYRPGSLLFKRKASAPPVMPTGESSGTLSHYFPGLSGGNANPKAPLLAKRTGDSKARLASNAPISVLPVGLRVETHPKPPSPTLPEALALARADEKPKAGPVEDAVRPVSVEEQLTSHEAPKAEPIRPPDAIDALLNDPQVEPVAVPQAKTEEADAPVDLASRPAGATVEVPPVVEVPVKPQRPPEPTLAVEPIRPSPGMPTSSLPRRSGEENPVLAGRPKIGRVQPMLLPPAEFPATYHSESMRRVLKEDVSSDLETRPAATSVKDARRTLFPRISRMLKPKDEEDQAVKKASHPTSSASTVAETGQISERGQGR